MTLPSERIETVCDEIALSVRSGIESGNAVYLEVKLRAQLKELVRLVMEEVREADA